MTNIEKFTAKYTEELRKDVVNNPEQYSYGLDFVPTVVERMVPSLKNGTASLSNAIRRTAKAMGIKPTMTQIREFLSEGADNAEVL